MHFHAFFVTPIPIYAHFTLILFRDIGGPFRSWRSTFKCVKPPNYLYLKLIQVPKHQAKGEENFEAPSSPKRGPR